MTKHKILIVCYDDTCLSPMIKAMLTQALCEHDLTKHFTIESAGLASEESHIGISATHHAITVLNKEGLDIHAHRSCFVGDLSPGLQKYYRVFTTTQETLRRLHAYHNAPKDRTVLLFEGSRWHSSTSRFK